MKRLARRWSDNDRRFGPFTYAKDSMYPIGLILDTGDDEYGGASLRAHLLGRTLILALPSVWRLGREYGFKFTREALMVLYGPQTMDSSTERYWYWSFPWLQWRCVQRRLFGLRGEVFHVQGGKSQDRRSWYEAEECCPKASFEFDDFDGERIVARTHLEEATYHRGTRGFRWLSAICRPRVYRSLDIEFSKETGRKKGSWKGGTVGHAIDVQPGELHESAFRRYCERHGMRFLGPAPAKEEA